MQLRELFSPEEMTLLQARAERVAVPLDQKNGTDHIPALIVLTQHEKYALCLDAITAVYEDVAIIPIPCTPDFVAGIANVRGHLITALDLAVLLGQESRTEAVASILLVADISDTAIGFRVEGITDVVELCINDMNPVPANMNLAQSQYLRGIFPDGVALLDMKAVLDDPRLVVDETSV